MKPAGWRNHFCAWTCDFCGRTIRDLSDHLPRCPALGEGAAR